MHEKEKVNALAYGAKWVVKRLDCNQEEKQFANSVIDLTAEALKLAVAVKDAAVERIRAAARLNNLDRVVVFPCFIEGKIQLCYRMHGGYIPAFCQQLGIFTHRCRRSVEPQSHIPNGTAPWCCSI